MAKLDKFDKYFNLWVLILLEVLVRVWPHSPNLSPFESVIILSVLLLNPLEMLFMTAVSLMISDMLLAWMWSMPVFGGWSWFTYSGFLALAFGASRLSRDTFRFLSLFAYGMGGVVMYWVWTNFGTWLTSGMYPHSGQGLLWCFVAALPFLKASLVALTVFLPCGWFVITRFCRRHQLA